MGELFLFFEEEEINTIIQQECIKLIKCNSINIFINV